VRLIFKLRINRSFNTRFVTFFQFVSVAFAGRRYRPITAEC